MNQRLLWYTLCGTFLALCPWAIKTAWFAKIRWNNRLPATQAIWPSKLRLTNVSGMPSPPFVTSNRILELSNGSFDHRGDDVWVVAYPKSGTTMVQVAVAALIGEEPLGLAEKDQRKYCPWPERGTGFASVAMSEFQMRSSPRCLKSHWPAVQHLRSDVRAGKVILIMRNVVDLVVSYFHHVQDAEAFFDFHGGWNEFFDLFLSGDVGSGSYFDYVASWWPHRGDSDLLWLRYEEAVWDRGGFIQKIADFIGPGRIEAGALERAERVTSFSHMRAIENTWGNWFMRQVGGRQNYRARDRQLGLHVRPDAVQFAKLEAEYERVLRPLGLPREWILGSFQTVQEQT